MKQYRFVGDPKKYSWDFKIKKGDIYNGDVITFNDMSLYFLIHDAELDASDDRKLRSDMKDDAIAFLADWEEVTND